jgi:hypothetical protein
MIGIPNVVSGGTTTAVFKTTIQNEKRAVRPIVFARVVSWRASCGLIWSYIDRAEWEVQIYVAIMGIPQIKIMTTAATTA